MMEVVVVVLVIVGLGMYYGVFGVLERLIRMGHKEVGQLEKIHSVSIVNRDAKLEKELSEEKVKAAKSFNQKYKDVMKVLDEEETA